MDKISLDKIIDVKETNLIEKESTSKTQSFYILLTFLLIAIALFIAVIGYCYLQEKAKQKHLLPFYDTKLKIFCVGSIN